jgi:hypothetical protein
MACLISTGASNLCQYSVGGLAELYLANHEEVVSVTDSNADLVLDTLTMKPIAVLAGVADGASANTFDTTTTGLVAGDWVKLNGTDYREVISVTGGPTFIVTYSGADLTVTSAETVETFYKIDFLTETAGLSQPLTLSNGQKYVTPTVVFSISKSGTTDVETAQRAELVKNLHLGKFMVIAVAANGQRFIAGINKGLEATAAEGGLGIAAGDLAGDNITLSVNTTEPIQVFSSTATIPYKK